VGSIPIVIPPGLPTGAFLTALDLFGTERAAALRRYVVGLLLTILVRFLGFVGLDIPKVFGSASTPERFAPFGAMSVFTTPPHWCSPRIWDSRRSRPWRSRGTSSAPPVRSRS
jgi:hypothetical protein